MANLTVEEYFRAQFSDPKWELIKAVRVDSPNSKWKRTVHALVWLIKKDKKHGQFASLYTNDFEADGTTYKKRTDGGQGYFNINFGYEFSKSKSEMELFISDSALQNDMIIKSLSEEAGIGDGPWSITQDPWDPNVAPKSLKPEADSTGPEKKEDPPASTVDASIAPTANNESPTVKPSINPVDVVGKFNLKVKSGPGVIIGVTEVDIVGGKADFSGIQFDTAGDYVVTVSSTSPDLDSTDINIKVLPPPEVIPQDSKGEDDKNASGTRPIIAQIDQPTIKLVPMKFARQETDVESSKQVATTIGLTPFLSFNGAQINDRDIQSFVLEHDGMIPKVSIIFRDSTGLISKEPPRDDTKFEIFLNSRSVNLKYIHLRFKIEIFDKLPNDSYNLAGTLDISDLYRNKFKVKRGTSFEVLREICKDLTLGFNSNIENTNDKMPWRNIGDKQYKFMEDIVKHSYISDESFMAGYIDFYYCFNYVDIEKEMKRDINNDVGIDTGGIDQPSEKDVDKIKRLILTTEKGQQSSNMIFEKKAERNESTKISIEQGYRTRTKFYDTVKKMFLVFDVDSTTSDGSKSHILKGGSNDKEAFDNNYVTKYNGKIDTDNVHKNHNYAVTQNRINLDNMMKNQMDISLPNPNFNLYRFQKIQVFVVKEAATVSSDESIQWRYSGEWMIASIKFTFLNGKLTQDITLARKEMGKNPKEIKEGTNNGTKETKETKNENPIVGSASTNITNKPNEKYKVGDVFTVQNAEGKRYVLTVTKLAENGVDIVATLKDPNAVPNQAVTGPDTIAGVTQSVDAAGPSASVVGSTASGTYPFEVRLEVPIGGGVEGDFSQSRVTSITKNHPFAQENGVWMGNTFVGNGTTTRIEPEERLENEKSIFIAIKRPLPTYKPEDWQKAMTPFDWTIFELIDEGALQNDMSDIKATKLYNILKYRMLNGIENFKFYFGDSKESWKVPKGYIRILDEEKKVVIESVYDDVNTPKSGSTPIDRDTGRFLTQGGYANGRYNYDRWFAFPGDGTPDATIMVDVDQEYTNVGDKNTIFYDMSDRNKYKPGVYTLEIKYYVPVYEKGSTDRLLTKGPDGYSPYEEKILTGTFTIVKKSKKK